jgi:hypothetical protein
MNLPFLISKHIVTAGLGDGITAGDEYVHRPELFSKIARKNLVTVEALGVRPSMGDWCIPVNAARRSFNQADTPNYNHRVSRRENPPSL